MSVVVADGLVKVFRSRRGEVQAVRGVSFQVEAGEIYGLLGPNGAGKTTTLRMLATLLVPTAGRAEVLGHDVVEEPQEVRAAIGFQASETGLYERLTPWETLVFFARIFGLSYQEANRRAAATLELLGLSSLRDRKVGTLSTGERQKLSLGRCLVHNPPVLILDEPTAGLDVFVARTVRELIRTLKDQGHTIILSTHDMHLAGSLCDRVGIIWQGKILAQGTPGELAARAGSTDFEEVFFRTLEEVRLSSEQAKVVSQEENGA